MSVQLYNLQWHLNHSDIAQQSHLNHNSQAQNAADVTREQAMEEAKLKTYDQIDDTKETEDNRIEDKDSGARSNFLKERKRKKSMEDEDGEEVKGDTGHNLDIKA